MKKLSFIFVLLVCLFSLPSVNAQTSKGTMLFGLSSGLNIMGEFTTGSNLMSLGFTTAKTKSNASGFTEPDPDKNTGINLMPKFGAFIIDNLAVGLDVTVAYSKTKNGGSSDNTSAMTVLLGGPFIRYYVPAGKVFPFAEGDVLFGTANSKDVYGGTTDKNKTGLLSFG